VGKLGEYPLPIGTIDNPAIGDVRTARELGRKSRCLHIWWPCPKCGKTRWVQNNDLAKTNYCQSCGQRKRGRKWDECELRQLYLGERLSPSDIGKIKGCSNDTITRALIRFNIPIRSLTEALSTDKHKKKLHDVGVELSQDERYIRKLSDASKINWLDTEYREKVTDATRVACASPEHKMKLSNAMNRRYSNPSEREKTRQSSKKFWETNPNKKNQVSKKLKEYWLIPEFRDKMSEIRKNIWARPEYREKMSKIRSDAWNNLEIRDKNRRALMDGMRIRPNKPERILQNLLDEYYPNEWRYTGDGSFIIGGLNPDFMNGNKQVIELFGTWWHSEEQVGDKWKSSELGRTMVFNSYGFRSLIIWEHELKNICEVIAKLKTFCKKMVGAK
jgi:G:T-mismatch repair DNA endonuclease (very short patch repair protein)